MSRIKLGDNGLDVIVKMSDGNIGAIQALKAIILEFAETDLQGASMGLGPILTLDTYQIYGTDIHVLYNDKCQKDVRKLFVLLAACHFGIMPESKLQSLAGDRMNEIKLADVEFSVLKVKIREHIAELKRA